MCRFLLARARRARRASTARRSASSTRSTRGYRRSLDGVPRARAGWRCRDRWPRRSRSSRSAGARCRASSRRSRTARTSASTCARPRARRFEYTQHQMDQIARAPRATRCPEIARALRDRRAGLGGGAVNTGLFNLYLTRSRASASASQERVFQQLSQRARAVHRRARLPGAAADDRRPPRRPAGPVRAPGRRRSRSCVDGAAGVPRRGEREPGAALRRRRPEGQPARGLDRASTAQRAAELGVSVLDVARTLQLAYGGQRFGYFLKNGRQYEVIGQVERARPQRARRTSRASSCARRGGAHGLARQPGALRRDGRARRRSTASTASRRRRSRRGLAPGYTRRRRHRRARRDRGASCCRPTIRTSLAGQSRDFARRGRRACSSRSRFALVLIYLVLAAQFESFRDPLDHPRHGAALARRRAR